jgi:hypothetical protein
MDGLAEGEVIAVRMIIVAMAVGAIAAVAGALLLAHLLALGSMQLGG